MSTIKGLDSLSKKLNALGGNAEKTVRRTMGDATQFVRDNAKLRCPVDTGQLGQSINKKVEEKQGKMVGTVYTNSDHATYVEFGTGQRGEETNTNTDVNVSYRQDWSGMAAQPYLYPALKDNQELIKEKFIVDLQRAIVKVAKK